MSEENRRLRYEDRMMPVMTEGRYKLVFGQQVSVFGPGGREEAADYNQKEQEFEVKSDKSFRIPDTAIHSVYPPEHAEGDFATHLAQITFMTDALPWERPIIGIGIPWLCLLLFDEADGVQVQKGTLETLFLEKGPEDLYVPDICIRDGDKAAEVCALDISREQMKEWLPAKTCLSYLTHVRQVSVEDKATHLYRTEGRFSNLICPRVPAKGADGSPVRTQVHAVSLEGYEGLYREDGGSQPDNSSQPDSGHKRVRLLSLTSWEFTSASKSTGDFDTLTRELDIGPLRRQTGKAEQDPPQTDTGETNQDKFRQGIEEMLDIGYAPMNYETREECRTLAWYRGPLIPANHWPVQNADTASCVNDSDGVLTYRPQTDMLDASYAAAWQLGLLLGIKNKPFMEALYAIRCKNYEEDAYKRSWSYARQVLDQAGKKEAENVEASAYERLMLTGLRLLGG